MSASAFPTSGQLPWLKAPYAYAGWVPTITGHLSFSLIGGPRFSPRCRTFNRSIANPPRRFVTVHQQRTAKDYVVPPGAVNVARPQATQDYFLIARSCPADTPYFLNETLKQTDDKQGVLFGDVVVLPRNRDKKAKHQRKALLKDIKGLLDQQPNPQADPEVIINAVCDKINAARLGGVACLAMRVALFRTGELRIWFDLQHFLGRKIHAQAIPPSPEELELAQLLPSQAYFFVKDITHLHYHHEPDSDQLLPLTRLQTARSAPDHQTNELSWRRETLWGLARVVSQFRQKNTLYDFKKLLGVLAYADAFQSTLAMVWRKQSLSHPMEAHGRLSRYDFAHTRSSVEAMESLSAWRRSGSLQLVAILAGVVLSSLALWAGAIQIHPIICPEKVGEKPNPDCPPLQNSNAIAAVKWVAENPLPFTVLVFLIGFAVFVLVFRDITFVPFGKRLQRALSRLSKAVGATMSRIIRQDSPLADWLGYISTLAVLFATFAGAVSLAVYREAVFNGIRNIVDWSLAFLP